MRFSYDITVHRERPTPMVCLMDVHRERRGDMAAPEETFTTPAVPTHTCIDMLGNVCRRFTPPPGDFSIQTDGIVKDSCASDPVWQAAQRDTQAPKPPRSGPGREEL